MTLVLTAIIGFTYFLYNGHYYLWLNVLLLNETHYLQSLYSDTKNEKKEKWSIKKTGNLCISNVFSALIVITWPI